MIASNLDKIHVFRFKPKQDLYLELLRFVEEQKVRAGIILTCVGSLSQACLRFAGAKEIVLLQGPFEITSLVGTLSPGGVHLHISLADRHGKTIGGHLMPKSLVNTTVEIAIGSLSGIGFTRMPDTETGYKELEITEG